MVFCLDDDEQVNSEIIDPVGLGTLNVSVPNTGLGKVIANSVLDYDSVVYNSKH